MDPSVSIVTPSYQQGPYLDRTIRSVLDQRYPRLEYVVMDGGSTDESLAILRRHEGRLRWVSEKDRGQAHAVNKAIALTTGEVIGWLNSDDVYLPGAIASAARFLADHPEIDIVYGQGRNIDADDKILGPFPTEEWNPRRLEDLCFLCQPAVFFRRRIAERFGPLDESLHFCLDYEYWLRLAAGGARFAYVAEPWAGARLYPTTKTLGSRLAAHRELLDMFAARRGRVPPRWLLNYACVVLKIDGSLARPRLWRLPALLPVALLACLRWNRSLAPDLLAGLASGAIEKARRRLEPAAA